MFLAVSILFSIFAFSLIYAVVDEPQWNDYCLDQPAPRYTEPTKEGVPAKCSDEYAYPSEEEIRACNAKDGQMQRKTDVKGCPAEYYCETCQKSYNDAIAEYNLWVFMMACALAVIAISFGITTPFFSGEFAEIIAPGFIIGGLFTLFFGTAQYFSDMGKLLRPIVMFFELCLVIYLIYRAVRKANKAKR